MIQARRRWAKQAGRMTHEMSWRTDARVKMQEIQPACWIDIKANQQAKRTNQSNPNINLHNATFSRDNFSPLVAKDVRKLHSPTSCKEPTKHPDNVAPPSFQLEISTNSYAYSYELPHRIHTSVVFPAKSSNGSTVIIYGHEHGVRIMWRGGRPFKPVSPEPTAPKKTNGSENAIISLDSDDEGPSISKYVDKPEFEDEEEELDPALPYPNILQTLDLPLGTAVLHLAILPAAFLRPESYLPMAFASLKDKIVFTAACADNSLRLVTLPLTPPSPSSKLRPEFKKNIFDTDAGHGSWGETITTLEGHARAADGVSMTLSSTNTSKELVRADSAPSALSEPSIIVSSHSSETTGLLLVFRIPLKPKLAKFAPTQRLYLSSPATCISFNPSHSAPRSNYLLVAESGGVCRIYDYSLLSRTSEESDSPAAQQGTWLLSLYTGFKSRKSDTNHGNGHGLHSGFGRKTILDAKWVSGGRAVMVLLDDGEWAVWDIEGVAPGTSHGLLGRQGIKGGSKSEFALNGYIESGTKSRPSGPAQLTGSKFAPMTPGTRKTAEPFSGRVQQTGPVRGQLSTLELPSHSSTVSSDESIVFMYGETFTLIPSLAKYWATNPQGAGGVTANPFAGTTGARMIKLEGVDLQGERCSGFTQIPQTLMSSGLPSDVLILGEHRLTILSAGKPSRQPQFRASGRPALTEKSANGELEDINRALTLMENSGTKRDVFG